MVVESIAPLGHYVKEGQVLGPNYLTGTFVIDDNSAHDFKVDGRGKGRLSIGIENPGDQTLTVQVYGMHSATANVDDIGVFPIGASWTVTDAQNRDYQVCNDPFPWYIVRVTPAAAATGSPTCTVYVDFSAF